MVAMPRVVAVILLVLRVGLPKVVDTSRLRIEEFNFELPIKHTQSCNPGKCADARLKS